MEGLGFDVRFNQDCSLIGLPFDLLTMESMIESVEMMNLLFSLSAIVVFALPLLAGSPTLPLDQLAGRYIDALIRNDLEGATACWDPEEVVNSDRLRIRYDGRPLKFDCTSPLFDLLPELRNGSALFRTESIDSQGDTARIVCRITRGGEEYPLPLHAIRLEEDWRLVSPVKLYSIGWQSIETKYFTLHARSETAWNRYSKACADSFVDHMAEILAIDSSRMALLQKEKIDYYLCDERSIRMLSGFDTHGITMLAQDAVLSRHFPHNHEVAHLMLNFALGDASLTVPTLLQEGFAVAFGGRWERSANVILEVGRFLVLTDPELADQIVNLDESLSDNTLADISYPLAGLFVRFLAEQYGIDSYLDLYRRLSTSDEIAGVKRIEAVEHSLGDEIDEVRARFNQFAEGFPSSGIDPVPSTPNPFSPLSFRMVVESVQISVYGGDLYQLRWTTESDTQSIALLLKPLAEEIPIGYTSSLFKRHFRGTDFDGSRYAIRVNPTEAGLYDYYRNELVAKFVADFRPGETIVRAKDETVSFVFNRSLIAGRLNDYTIRLLPD